MAYTPDLTAAQNRYGAMAQPTSWFDSNGFTGNQPGSPVGPNIAPPGPLPYAGAPPPGTIQPGGWQDPGPQGGNYQEWFNSLFAHRPFDQETLRGLEPLLKHYGINLTPPNAAGDQTKIQLPDGTWVRVGFGEGHPVWVPQGMGGGAGAGNRAGATPGADGGAGAGGINSPWAIPAPFQSPSAADLQNEPGYQARYQMGLQGLERGAAAQGSLLSGGTQKALARYGQDYASGEYGNAYNRAMNNYMTNFNVQSQTPWNRYQEVLNRGLTASLGTKTPVPLR
jgi:hypothetical protein